MAVQVRPGIVELFDWPKQEAKYEHRSVSVLGLEVNMASKRLNDLFGYHQAKTDSTCVHLSCVLKAPKQLEQFGLVLLLDPNTRVLDRNDKFVPVKLRPKDELESIGPFLFNWLFMSGCIIH